MRLSMAKIMFLFDCENELYKLVKASLVEFKLSQETLKHIHYSFKKEGFGIAEEKVLPF